MRPQQSKESDLSRLPLSFAAGSVGLSRRLALALGFVFPHLAIAKAAPSNSNVTKLLKRAEEANAAFIRGRMDDWYDIVSPISKDFTLMQPFGGAPSRGFDGSPAHLAEMARYFQKGEATLEVVQTYASPQMIALVVIERQHGEVGDLSDQDWSLRVTLIYQLRDGDWHLVHRHADPLVRNIGLERTAELARG